MARHRLHAVDAEAGRVSAPPIAAELFRVQPMQPTAAQRKAYAAFQTQLPGLLGSAHRGQWALFHGDDPPQFSDSRDELYQLAAERGLEDNEIFVDLVAPEPEDFDAECLLDR